MANGKQKTAYEIVSGDWSSDVCSSDLHGLFQPAHGSAPDIMGEDNMESYAVLCRDTSCPVAVSERLATKYRFREVLAAKAADIIILDIAWCGGISEWLEICRMTEAYPGVHVVPHCDNFITSV